MQANGKQDFADTTHSFLKSLPSHKEPQHTTIGLYLPLGFEADITTILKDTRFSAFNFALPYINDQEQMHFLTYDVNQTKIEKASYGFMQPVDGEIVIPDIILAPLLAFDDVGNRLGYGKGHYDTYIERARQVKELIYIGVAFKVQKSLELLPIHSGDQKLDSVLLPDTYINFRR